MREIKFKCWIPASKKMLILESTTENHNHYLQVGSGGFWLYASLTGALMANSEAGDILLQFTGLLDKNGKEIYEGDLIKAKNYNYQHTDKIVYQIGYSTTSMMFCLEEKVDKDAIRCNVIHGFHSLEIIGDIYSNPELLTHSESK